MVTPKSGDITPLSMIPITRILLNEDGHAVPPTETLLKNIPIGTVWVRNDGWSIASGFILRIKARNLWHSQWVGVWNRIADEPGFPDRFEYTDLTQDETKLASNQVQPEDIYGLSSEDHHLPLLLVDLVRQKDDSLYTITFPNMSAANIQYLTSLTDDVFCFIVGPDHA